MKPRPKIKFLPQWKGPIEGYTINTIKSYYPRLQSAHEFEDLIQEAYLKFMQCCRHYTGKVDNGAWFMALYKRALTNQFNNMLEKNGRYSFIDYQDSMTMPESQTTGTETDVIEVLRGLPKEFIETLNSMSDFTEISKDLKVMIKSNRQTRREKALHEYLCQKLGV